METYSLLIKTIGSGDIYTVQKKLTRTTDNSVVTDVVHEKTTSTLSEAFEILKDSGIKESEIIYSLEVLAENEHNYASFGINKNFVTSMYIGILN